MARKYKNITSFYGGIAENEKTSSKPASFGFSKNINIHEDPNYLIPMPGPTKVSGSTVTDLVKWAEDGTPFDTNRYFYGDGGKIYRETSGGTWSSLRTVSGGSGQGLKVFDDYLYYTTSTTLGRYGRLTGTPSFNDDFLTDGTTNLDQYFDTSGNTYTLTTSINEGDTHRQTFTPKKDPIKSIEVNISAVGTGDWTLTVHDKNDVSIGSVTISNGSLSTGDYEFTFSTALRIIIDNEYHFHLTSTVGDGTVVTRDSSDLETCDFHTYFGILITDSNFHPIETFLNFLVIGNGNYVAVWDQALYEPNKIRLAPGFKVRDFAVLDEWLVISCWRGDSIDSVEHGRLYFWDGTSTTFNYYRELPMGLPHALHTTSKGELFGIYGIKGTIHLGTSPFKEVQDTPKLSYDKKVEVYPGAVTEWQGKTYIGYAGSSDDTTGLEMGVYEYGSKNNSYQDSLNMVFTSSEGSTQNANLSVGCVQGFGEDLYISYSDTDGSSYRVDKVSMSNNSATSGNWNYMYFDNDEPQKEKLPIALIITFDPIVDGDTITPKYELDRSGTFVTGDTFSTVGSTRAIYTFSSRTGIRFKEIRFGYNFTTNNTRANKVRSVMFIFDDLSEEREYNAF